MVEGALSASFASRYNKSSCWKMETEMLNRRANVSSSDSVTQQDLQLKRNRYISPIEVLMKGMLRASSGGLLYNRG